MIKFTDDSCIKCLISNNNDQLPYIKDTKEDSPFFNIDLTLQKIAIWLSKNCQKLDIFFQKNCQKFSFFSEKLPLAIFLKQIKFFDKFFEKHVKFLTFNWQFSRDSDSVTLSCLLISVLAEDAIKAALQDYKVKNLPPKNKKSAAN